MKAKQHKILDSVLVYVPQHGWTAEAFIKGAEHAKVLPAETARLFPNGITDVVALFHQSIDEAMQAKIDNKRNFPVLRVREKSTFAVRARLEFIEPYRDAMQRLLVWSLRPRNVRDAAQHIWQAADKIWVAAGDTSTDYNFYTKRILLIAVMKSTLSFWLNDETVGHKATWDFLDRRIEDVMKLGKGIDVIKTVGLSDMLSFMRNKFANKV